MNQSEANHTGAPEHPLLCYALTPLLISNVAVALPVNVYVVWLIGSGASGPAAANLSVLNLAISEILSCCVAFYLLFHFLLGMSRALGLHVLQFASHLMLVSRPVFNSAICLERYTAVVHPTVFLRFKPPRYRLACCVLTWLLILLYSVVPAFTLSTIQSLYLLIAVSMFLLVLTMYCGVHVLCVLKQPGPGDGSRDGGGRSSARRKAFKVIVITLVFTSGSQALRVFVLGPTLLFASNPLGLIAILITQSIGVCAGFLVPLLFLHRAGKLPCIHF